MGPPSLSRFPAIVWLALTFGVAASPSRGAEDEPAEPVRAPANGVWQAETLGMVPRSMEPRALAANRAGFAALYGDESKRRMGALAFGPGAYFFDQPLTTARLSGLRLSGAGGIELYESENHYGPNAWGGGGTRLVAAGEGMDSLLNLTTYGARLENLTLQGQWRHAANEEGGDPTYRPATPPAALVRLRSNPGGYGTGKSVFDNIAMVRGRDGFLFGDREISDNADNCHFTRLEAQFLSGAAFRSISNQSVVFTIDQLHLFFAAEGLRFDRGGHIEAPMIEVVSGWEGRGTKVLRLGDVRENENHYRIGVRVDNTALLAGLKIIQMDAPGFGTFIDCYTSFGHDAKDQVRRCYELKGAVQLVLRGGPFFADMIMAEAADDRRPSIVYQAAVFDAGVNPADTIDRGASAGRFSVRWYGCVDTAGNVIPDGGVEFR